MTSKDAAKTMRAEEAEVIAEKDVKVVILGRQYTFPVPSRRENRQMFAELTRIQMLTRDKDNRMSVVMKMFDCLIDWNPAVEADEAKIDDAVRAELAEGKSDTTREIVKAFREVAAQVARPFQSAASVQTAAKDT